MLGCSCCRVVGYGISDNAGAPASTEAVNQPSINQLLGHSRALAAAAAGQAVVVCD